MKRQWTWMHLGMIAMLSIAMQPAEATYNVGTKFADVIMEFVQPGKVYNLRTMRNLPYRVVNKSDGPVDLSIQVEIPPHDQLKPGYEAIPDPSWVRLSPSHLKLAAGEEGLADVILQVPEGEQFTGHHYQAHIICQTADAPPGESTALAFGITLASRLRFSVGIQGPEEIRRMQKKGIYQMLNFTLEPDLQFMPGFIEPGQKVALSDKGVALSLVNRSPQKLNFSLKSVAAPAGIGPAAGYELGDPAWIKVVPNTVRVPGESIKGAKLEVELPNDPTLRGRRFMFVIQAGLEGRDIPVEVFSRVYVNVAK
jgi:hypothetical protein